MGTGAVGGFFDGHPLVNWRHENLMRLFFRALRAYVKPGGVVKALGVPIWAEDIHHRPRGENLEQPPLLYI